MRRGLLVAALLATAASGGCLELGAPQATIHVFNEEATAIELRITDSETCQLGMTTQINQNTRTTYDVDAKGAFVCVGPGATTAFPVTADGYYMVKAGALVEDPNPEAANEAGAGILGTLEKAGREAQGK